MLATHIATALRAGVAQPTRIPERVWVTGASSGLGEEVAAAYAARGCALVLSARRRRELDRVAACVEINQDRHPIEQASRRWRGGRRADSARRRRELLISTQVAARCREAGAPTAEVVLLDQGDAESVEQALQGALAAPLDVVVLCVEVNQ